MTARRSSARRRLWPIPLRSCRWTIANKVFGGWPAARALNSLTPKHRTTVEAWSRALDIDPGFERFIGWMTELAFKLPLNGEIGNIRAYVLPERIGVMTMRSLTPHREEDGGRVDDGV